jgi:lambda family phage portal protein
MRFFRRFMKFISAILAAAKSMNPWARERAATIQAVSAPYPLRPVSDSELNALFAKYHKPDAPAEEVAVLARYEGATHSIDRCWLPGYVQSARQDIDSSTRLELLRRARYFEKNHYLIQKILDMIEVNVVGTGISAVPSSSDARFNAAALRYFKRWAKQPDASSHLSFYTLQSIIARAEFLDGEVFVFLTRDEQGPKIQLIESHRVVPAHLPTYASEGYTDVDGILIDQRGRPSFYIVSNDADAFAGCAPQNVTVIPAAQMVHIYNPARPSQYRGITNFHAAMHTLHDLHMLQTYEMQAAKNASLYANVVNTESGELPEMAGNFGRSLAKQSSTATDPVARAAELEKAFGGRTVALKVGESWQQAQSDRPNPQMREFWKDLEASVCKAAGVSYASVSDYTAGQGGAALRGAVTADARFYQIRSNLLSDGLQRIYEFVIQDGIDEKAIVDEAGVPVPAPADSLECVWPSPRRASVDIGRDTTAKINELRAGGTCYRDYIGEGAGDWREIFTQRADEEAFLDELARTRGISAQRIASLFPNGQAPAVVPQQQAAPAAQTQGAPNAA